MWRLALLLLALLAAAPGEILTGIVVDAAGQPMASARVRLRTSATMVTTGVDGRFMLADPAAAPGGEVTAAQPGHVIGGTTIEPGVFDYRIQLADIPPGDDPTYVWVTAFPEDDQAPRTDFGREPCGACHRRILAEWSESAHARAALNPRVSSAMAKIGTERTQGCRSCHTPMTGPVASEGIGCDFCHKVADIGSKPVGGGRDSFAFRRPPFGRQAIFGPFDDVPRGRDVFAPVFAESRFCAACHQSPPGAVAIYSDFEEWRASRFAAEGRSCQSCHMQGDGKATSMSDLGPGRAARDPRSLSSHRFHDGASLAFAKDAVETAIDVRAEGDDVTVDFDIRNAGGHHLPGGSPLRQMRLAIIAETGGKPLEQVEGPRLDGSAGRVYAKTFSGADPWDGAAIAADTRIPAGSNDRSTFRFRRIGDEPVHVTARLAIRRDGGDEIEIAAYARTVPR